MLSTTEEAARIVTEATPDEAAAILRDMMEMRRHDTMPEVLACVSKLVLDLYNERQRARDLRDE